MRVLISSGHTLKGKGTGSVGYINEGTENRILSNIVVKYLKKAGHEVDYYEINEGSDYLAKQVAKANSKNYDLVVQIHFNAFKLFFPLVSFACPASNISNCITIPPPFLKVHLV